MKQRRSYPLNICLAVLAASILAVTAVMAVGELPRWEASWFEVIYQWPKGLKPLFLALTLMGSSWAVGVLVLGALYRRRVVLASQLLLAGVLANWTALLIKELIERPRPFELLPGVGSQEFFIAGYGFPSGHTAVATALALTLLPNIPLRIKPLIVMWIGGVALSRIYLGVHFPLDIVGGLAVGILSVQVVRLLHLKLKRIDKRQFRSNVKVTKK